MDNKILLGGLVLATGVLYYAYDSYQKARDVAYHGGGKSGAFSINLTEQRGIPTQFSTALDDHLYSSPPASQDDQIVANLPPAVGAGTDGICGVSNVDEYDLYAGSDPRLMLSPADRRALQAQPELFSTYLAGKKTLAGCFPTTR
jgi:hypothetical protein